MSDAKQLNDLINRLVSASDPEEVKTLYQQWAVSYDKDLDGLGYVAPKVGVAKFTDLVSDRRARVHDAGCGTGLVGKLLSELGYQNIDGSDFSQDMLSQAKETGCYKNLHREDYSGSVSFPDQNYDGIISIGVYTKRFKRHFIDEMLRILKPGGFLVFSCRPLYFEEVGLQVMQQHQTDTIKGSNVTKDHYITGQDASAYYVSLQKR